MRLAVENKELWLIYAAGKMQIPDVSFLVPNLIPFVSLMLVTKLRPRIKALGIAMGSVILCGYHVFTLILVIQKLAQRWLYLYLFPCLPPFSSAGNFVATLFSLLQGEEGRA
jgi:hypothetical protein